MNFFKEYLPFLSVCIIISGLLYQMVYYNHFEVEIQYYISVSELFLVLCNKIAFMFYIPLLAVAMVYVKFELSTKTVYATVIFGIIVMLILIFVNPSDIFIIVAIGLLTIALIYPSIVKFFDSGFSNTADINAFHKFFYVISTIIYFILIVILQATRDINNTEKGNYIGTTIVTKDSTYISTENHYFIGKTANYYFILNKEKDNSSILVLPEREVSQFKLKNRRLHYAFN